MELVLSPVLSPSWKFKAYKSDFGACPMADARNRRFIRITLITEMINSPRKTPANTRPNLKFLCYVETLEPLGL